ncbi:MAG: hypothetical protein ABSE63_10535 [Thermoguttaceae bacterium]|jgi:hypothetical protein
MIYASVWLAAGQRAVSLDGAEMVYVPAGPFIMGSDLKEIETALSTTGHFPDD